MWSRERSLALLTLFKEEQRKIDNKRNFVRNFIGNICFKQKLGISCQGDLFIQAKPDTKEAKKKGHLLPHDRTLDTKVSSI